MKRAICTGGKKRTNGKFSYFENGHFQVGLRHTPLSKIDRYRFFNLRKLLYKREYNYLKFVHKL